jgi:hypothetical protein
LASVDLKDEDRKSLSQGEPFFMNLPDEPKEWRCLQEMAQQAPDTHSLTLVIAEMNRILDDHQNIDCGKKRGQAAGKMCAPGIRLEVQLSQ